MKNFKCPNCRATLFFENTKCENCGNTIGFDLSQEEFVIPHAQNNFKFCKNHRLSVCNWVVDFSTGSQFCVACELNGKVPNSADEVNFKKWQKLEIAKHRLVYQLSKLGLPLISKIKSYKGIVFDFLSPNNADNKLTGHADGVITILLSEADSVHREQLKKEMDEPYRTLLGHFRHEIGHYYWPLLFEFHHLQDFRNLFGDESQDYNASLKRYYNNGAPSHWNLNFISKYASSHPWEDWAETWAHYLHIMDTLETANSFGLSFSDALIPNQPYGISDFKEIFDASVALTCAANSLNRSMGLQDIYPFVVPNPVYKKLEFIHSVLLAKN
ncbi:UNVERIFIED_CONTAM: hypothetical protein GTU68_018207 [Idotea baltica]|nr:hypothetical protein [Idotea baltica]